MRNRCLYREIMPIDDRGNHRCMPSDIAPNDEVRLPNGSTVTKAQFLAAAAYLELQELAKREQASGKAGHP